MSRVDTVEMWPILTVNPISGNGKLDDLKVLEVNFKNKYKSLNHPTSSNFS